MKRFKGFIAFLLIILAGTLIFTYKPPVQVMGEASQALKVYYDIKKADEINSSPISVVRDGQPVELKLAQRPYMTENMQLMAPVTTVPLLFLGNVDVLRDGSLKFSANGHEVIAAPGSDTCVIDSVPQTVVDPVIERRDTLYVSMELLSTAFGGSLTWNEESHQAELVSGGAKALELPAAYDMRDQGRVSPVRDQGSFGTCWAFASLGALESSRLPKYTDVFSADHMSFLSGYNITQQDGGDFNMALAYLTSWKGPVKELDDPYGDGVANDSLQSVVHLQEAVNIESKDYDSIKAAIYSQGGVQSSFYSDMEFATSNSSYYNASTASYYYPGKNIANHDIVIVGWDDHYPKENFNVHPENDGAFLCRNSWGAKFGDGGYFYISYEDTNIGIDNLVYTRIDDTDNYDFIYQSDLLGFVGTMGYGEPTAWFSNVYTASEDELLSAVSFYTTGEGSCYELYVVKDFTDTSSFDTMEYIKSGYIARAGYYTLDLADGISLKAGSRFGIVVKLFTPGSERPVAIEYATGEWTSGVDLSDGEGYLSYNGTLWENIEGVYQSNACLKAFTTKAR